MLCGLLFLYDVHWSVVTYFVVGESILVYVFSVGVHMVKGGAAVYRVPVG